VGQDGDSGGHPGKYVAYVLSHCPTLPAIEVPGGNVEYQRGAGGGNASLGSFGEVRE